MRLFFLSILGLSALLPMLPSYAQSSSNSTSTCDDQIWRLEDQMEVIFSPRIVHFVESNTAEFKLLSQEYTMYWLNTNFDWNTDVSKCSAQLQGTTVSYLLSSSNHLIKGEAHITLDPSLTKVLAVKIESVT
jgi:hypothetical protein